MGHSLGRAQRRRGHFLIGRAQERTGPQCFLGLLNLGLSFILKLDHFNVLMLEMKFLKNIILIYFQTKNTLKNNNYYPKS